MNYGELISPLSLPAESLAGADGRPLRLQAFLGRWIMLQVDRAECDEYCEKKIYHMRQVRLTQGKEMGRVERVWLISDDAALREALLRNYPGMHVARAAGSALIARLPASRDVRDHIYLVDPLGKVMLRYPRDPDPSRMKKDLERLLKVSQVG